MASPRRTRPSPNPKLERLFGKHAVRAALLARPKEVERLLLAGKEAYHSELIALAHRHDVPVFLLPWPEFLKAGRLTDADRHQGALAFARPRTIYAEPDLGRLERARCVVVLDQLSNPQNLAAILRSAAFFRADAVVYMRHRSATPTPEVARLAVGGAELVDLYCVANVAHALDELRDMGFAVVGLDERGTRTLAELDMGRSTAFVVGAEGEGLRPKVRAHCTELARIPGGRAGLESLNAGVAATIALYEFARLRAGES
jgi:23S rRNA (guanosine2251-2'-O)-methyltransferase